MFDRGALWPRRGGDLFACTLAAEVLGPKAELVTDEIDIADDTINTTLAIIDRMKKFMNDFWMDENRYAKAGVDLKHRHMLKTIENLRYMC